LQIALCCCVFAGSQHLVRAQAPTEADALAAIKLATNPTTKLAAAEDFVTKFPNSNARLEIAGLIAAEISRVRNGSVALALLERARAVFTADQEWEILKPVALGAYASGNRPDEAFALASELLAKNPDDLWVLVRMTQLATDEARKRNRKYAETALQYGLRAIALLEKGATEQAALGQLYQQTAILYLASGNTQEAKSRLTKASALAPHDPANFALLGRVFYADYLSQEDALEVMPDGKAKQEARRRLDAVLDSMIDVYARAARLATGRVEHQMLLQQVLPDLTTYYKQRHGSTKGLKQFIFGRR
jgi:tetratricopeptide (TPR) repeat protein